MEALRNRAKRKYKYSLDKDFRKFSFNFMFFTKLQQAVLFLILFVNVSNSFAGTIQFSVLSVSSNVNDLDNGSLGNSDPEWKGEIFHAGVSLGSFTHLMNGVNCPGNQIINNQFALYNSECAFGNFQFRWSGGEKDATSYDAYTNVLNSNISSTSLSTFDVLTNIATFSATGSGSNCISGNTVTWTITLQYFKTGSFFSPNTMPTSISTSSTNVLVDSTFQLAQIGGFLQSGSGSQYSWRRASCIDDPLDYGSTILTSIDNTETFYLRIDGGCNLTSNCISITINAISNPLNIGNSGFKVSCEEKVRRFEWESTSQNEVDYFEIYAKQTEQDEFIHYQKIEKQNLVIYNFDLPVNSKNYFRLIEVSLGNKKVIGDAFSRCINEFSIGPNPVSTNLNFYDCEDLERIEVYNAQGTLIYSLPILSNLETIDFSQIEKGVYFAQCISKESSKNILVKKFIVQH